MAAAAAAAAGAAEGGGGGGGGGPSGGGGRVTRGSGTDGGGVGGIRGMWDGAAAASSEGLANGMDVRARSAYAFATLLYTDEFLVGARTLGASLAATGTRHDMVALVAPSVSPRAEAALMRDGWRVRRVTTRANPNADYPSRFWGVYTKLEVFALTDYERVVYLDADTLVVQSLDSAFDCAIAALDADADGAFCANLKHSDKMNTGVMVLTPSAELHDDMAQHASTVASYTGGDQGFLNVYFSRFANAPVWRASTDADTYACAPVDHGQALARLPGGYNYDVGLYIINSNRWMVSQAEVFVVHFTLGPLKPWQWYAGWAVPTFRTLGWTEARSSLEAECAMCWAGAGWPELKELGLLAAAPILALAVFERTVRRRAGVGGGAVAGASATVGRGLWHPRLRSGSGSGASPLPLRENGHAHAHRASRQVSARLRSAAMSPSVVERMAIAYGLASALAGVVLAASVVPTQLPAALGWALFYEWLFVFVRAAYVLMAAMTHGIGAMRASSPAAADAAGLSPAAGGSLGSARRAAITGAALALALPWASAAMGVYNIYAHIGLVCVGVATMVGFIVRMAPGLALESYRAGWSDCEKKFLP